MSDDVTPDGNIAGTHARPVKARILPLDSITISGLVSRTRRCRTTGCRAAVC
jgi:hypothetical protein